MRTFILLMASGGAFVIVMLFGLLVTWLYGLIHKSGDDFSWIGDADPPPARVSPFADRRDGRA